MHPINYHANSLSNTPSNTSLSHPLTHLRVHYVCFDLQTGLFIANDSIEKKIPQLLVIPCLFLTMMLGPTGLLLYFVVRTTYLDSPKYLEKVKKMLSNGSATTNKKKK